MKLIYHHNLKGNITNLVEKNPELAWIRIHVLSGHKGRVITYRECGLQHGRGEGGK